jgi:hypothetical protein
MNIRTNVDVVEIQVDEDEWRPIEDISLEASNADRSVRVYILERYGKVIDTPCD